MAEIKTLTLALQLDSANFLQIMGKLAAVLDSTSKDEQVQLIGEIVQLLTDSVAINPAITNKLESIDSELKLLHKVAQNIEKRFVDADNRAIRSLQLMGRLDLGTQIREVGTPE